ncbi:MAG: 2Fe-2S iron-sulfur cluster-binding protein [Flavisolibacter sp.]
MFKIKINFEKNGMEPVTLENITNGQTLLDICLKHNIGLPHNCGGVCACSTCHIYVLNGGVHMEEMSVREKHFVARSVNPQPDSRLGCQCLLIGDDGEVEVMIPNVKM